ADDDVIANGHAGVHHCIAAYPYVGAYTHWLCVLYVCVAHGRVGRMRRGVDVHVGAEVDVVSELDLAYVQDSEASVGIEVAAEIYPVAVVKVDRRGELQVLRSGRKARAQLVQRRAVMPELGIVEALLRRTHTRGGIIPDAEGAVQSPA